jgi:hypothetical protein
VAAVSILFWAKLQIALLSILQKADLPVTLARTRLWKSTSQWDSSLSY